MAIVQPTKRSCWIIMGFNERRFHAQKMKGGLKIGSVLALWIIESLDALENQLNGSWNDNGNFSLEAQEQWANRYPNLNQGLTKGLYKGLIYSTSPIYQGKSRSIEMSFLIMRNWWFFIFIYPQNYVVVCIPYFNFWCNICPSSLLINFPW